MYNILTLKLIYLLFNIIMNKDQNILQGNSNLVALNSVALKNWLTRDTLVSSIIEMIEIKSHAFFTWWVNKTNFGEAINSLLENIQLKDGELEPFIQGFINYFIAPEKYANRSNLKIRKKEEGKIITKEEINKDLEIKWWLLAIFILQMRAQLSNKEIFDAEYYKGVIKNIIEQFSYDNMWDDSESSITETLMYLKDKIPVILSSLYVQENWTEEPKANRAWLSLATHLENLYKNYFLNVDFTNIDTKNLKSNAQLINELGESKRKIEELEAEIVRLSHELDEAKIKQIKSEI